jgi:hypothetical protein
MFSKKCSNCKKKSSKSANFCSYCGNKFKENKEGFGMFGTSDEFNDISEIKLPLGFNMLFRSIMKELNKQLSELDNPLQLEQNMQTQKRKNVKKIHVMPMKGISISISSVQGTAPEIKVQSFNGKSQKSQKVSNLKRKSTDYQTISGDKLKLIGDLPKEEAKTSLRRLANKLVYEIFLPGVESLDNIALKQLENSIEVKAIGKDKAYFKLIPVHYPIQRYALKDEKLILEMDSRE